MQWQILSITTRILVVGSQLLTSGPKISNAIKYKFFKLNLAQNDGKVEAKYFSADFRTFWDSLTRSLANGSQKK